MRWIMIYITPITSSLITHMLHTIYRLVLKYDKMFFNISIVALKLKGTTLPFTLIIIKSHTDIHAQFLNINLILYSSISREMFDKLASYT